VPALPPQYSLIQKGNACVFNRQSALGRTLISGKSGLTGERTLTIGEVRGFTLFQLAIFGSLTGELQEAVRPVLGIDLPVRVGVTARAEDRCVLKIGPRQFWIVTQNNQLPTRLRSALPPTAACVTSLSHSRTRIFIQGSTAREVLSKGIALDLHPAAFGTDAFAITALHHTPVLLHCTGSHRYELYVMRTFAASIWEWLADAAWSVGYDVSVRE